MDLYSATMQVRQLQYELNLMNESLITLQRRLDEERKINTELSQSKFSILMDNTRQRDQLNQSKLELEHLQEEHAQFRARTKSEIVCLKQKVQTFVKDHQCISAYQKLD